MLSKSSNKALVTIAVIFPVLVAAAMAESAEGLQPHSMSPALVSSPKEGGPAVSDLEAALDRCFDELASAAEMRSRLRQCTAERARQAAESDQYNTAIAECRGRIVPQGQDLVPAEAGPVGAWIEAAISQIVSKQLGLRESACQQVEVGVDIETGVAEIGLRSPPETAPDDADVSSLTSALMALLTGLETRIQRLPPSADCRSPIVPETPPATDPPPDHRTHTDGIAVANYDLRLDSYGEAALVLPKQLSAIERRRAPKGTDCPDLGTRFEEATPPEQRLVDAFVVIEGERALTCSKFSGRWHVDRSFTQGEAHLLQLSGPDTDTDTDTEGR